MTAGDAPDAPDAEGPEGGVEVQVEVRARPFVVAIVGRPNVGKSTLFNRLVGKRLALVDDRPGVTRDRREGEAKLGDLEFTVVDTAGLEQAEAGSLGERMLQGTEAAIAGADLVLFVVDARAGVTPIDRLFGDLARRTGKPVVLVANKAEGRAGDAGALDAFGLGLGDPIALSAEHGDGLVDLYDALRAGVDAAGEQDGGEGDKPLRFAVVGRPNAGKSTLVNRLLGEERQLVGPEAGITRDSIGLDLSWRGKPYRVFDTAGLRRRANVQEKLEKLAVADALRAVRFAEVVVVLLDAQVPFEKQDLSIVDLVETEGRALVVALNKWDVVEDPNALAVAKERFERLLPQVKGAALVPVSASTGRGLDRLMAAVVEAAEVWDRRVSTGRLNRWLEAALADHSPPAVAGRRIKIRYLTQVKARPPHFALFGNQLDALPEGYRRYLVNGLRKAFDLPGTPIRLSTRGGENPFEGKKEAPPRRPVRAQDRKRTGAPQAGGRKSSTRPSGKS